MGNAGRVFVVEDRTSTFLGVVKAVLRHGGHPEPVGHGDLIDGGAELDPDDLVLLDALDLGHRQVDPQATAIRSLLVLERFAALAPDERPTVVVYSTEMADPTVAVPLAHTGIPAAHYGSADLVEHLGWVLRRSWEGSLPQPPPSAVRGVHAQLSEHANLAWAHNLVHARPDAWAVLADARHPFDRNVQRWMQRNVLPVLGLGTDVGYRVAVDSLRAVARLPP